MRAQEITFLELVQGDKQFQVPLYQRTYSWGREQLQRPWDDVSELVEQHMPAPEGSHGSTREPHAPSTSTRR